MSNDENPSSNTNGQLVSRKARDIALFGNLLAIFTITILCFFKWPIYESGVMTGLIVFTNAASYLLGTKSALATPSSAKIELSSKKLDET
jgi:hypothetical protein